MLNTEEIASRVSGILAAKLGINTDRINETARIDADLQASSLDIVEAIMSLEDEFGIEISDQDSETLHTVGDVLALVRKKLH